MGPLLAGDSVEGMNVHHADQAIVADHQMAASAGAQHFGAVFLQSDVSRNCGHFLAHNVGSAEASEGFPDGHLSDALLRGVQNEPSDQDRPEHLHIAVNDAPRAKKNHRVGDHFSAGARDASGLLKTFGRSPNDSAENSSSVERKSGQEIEHR